MKSQVPLGLLKAGLLLLVHQALGKPTELFSRDPQSQLIGICNKRHPGSTPLDQPAYKLGSNEPSEGFHPKQFLPEFKRPVGKKVARWQKKFFYPDSSDDDSDLKYQNINNLALKSGGEDAENKEDPPTIITAFFADPDEGNRRRPLENYLVQYKRLATLYQRIIVYTTPDMEKLIRDENRKAGINQDYVHIVTGINEKYIHPARGTSPQWKSEWKTVWDLPVNEVQKHNFEITQPEKFKNLRNAGVKKALIAPSIDLDAFNKPFLSGAYHSKAFACYHAAMYK